MMAYKSVRHVLCLRTLPFRPREFMAWWMSRRHHYHAGERRAIRNHCWRHLLWWLRTCHRLMRRVIPDGRTTCVVETRQEYAGFSTTEMVQSLRAMGKLAEHFSCAARDVFYVSFWFDRVHNPLAKYYVEELEQAVWLMATFAQTDYKRFTPLAMRAAQLLGVKGYKR